MTIKRRIFLITFVVCIVGAIAGSQLLLWVTRQLTDSTLLYVGIGLPACFLYRHLPDAMRLIATLDEGLSLLYNIREAEPWLRPKKT